MTPADSSCDSIVRVRNLTKVFRDFWRRPSVTAVDGLNLDIRPGEVFGLLGPNGSGKSTTIKLLLGLLSPSQGEIRVLGRPPDDVAAKSEIGYLPEESFLYRFLTARETLDFYARLFGLSAAERRRKTDELLAVSGLAQAADRPVGEFSKGMARRIALAQALINEPRLLILDEPTAGLDPIACRQVKNLILDLGRKGTTVLLTSHLLADVEDVCGRIAILHNGRLRAEGRVSELLSEPDRMTFSVPVLPAGKLAELLRLFREKAGCEAEVRHPSRNLEQFFLDVVAEAGRASGAPSAASDRSANISDPEQRT